MMKISKEDLTVLMEAVAVALMKVTDDRGLRIMPSLNPSRLEQAALKALNSLLPEPANLLREPFFTNETLHVEGLFPGELPDPMARR